MSRLLLVSNRLPVTVKLDGEKVAVTPSTGGLATGLKGPHQQSGGLWIGWPGEVSRFTESQRRDVDAQLANLRCAPVYLTAQEVNRYYEGFSNRVLWPLFHYLLDRIPLHSRDWETYRQVNEKFADAVVQRYEKGDVIWVHDYQLLLVPGMIRQKLPEARIGFFLHIPFPSSEIFRILPWRQELLEGVMGADLVGFHTLTYARHFGTSLLRILGVQIAVDRVKYRGRDIRVGAFPMGIDAKAFASCGELDEVKEQVARIRQQAAGAKILLGVDRLDYTKGIPRRLLAVERVLERNPSLRGKLRLIQVAVPSRTRVDQYEQFRQQVDELVGRINGAFGTIDSTPIHYLYQSFNQKELCAMYRAADVLLVTALRDGMNLVAKEFVATRTDDDGVLVLSEFAGAADELGEAVLVNPYDVDTIARAIVQALEMPEEERKVRMHALRQRVNDFDVHHWAKTFIETLEQTKIAPKPRALRISSEDELSEVVSVIAEAPKLALLLDYDGTLVSFVGLPELAAPGEALRSLLTRLSGLPNTQVHLVSGRKREQLDRWLGDLPLGLHAEHGLWSKDGRGQDWRLVREVPRDWKEKVRPILNQFATLVPGSLVEEKTASLAWHYRMAEAEYSAHQANELYLHLTEVFANLPVEVMSGDKVVEVRPHGISKALSAQRVHEMAPDALLVALGDDRTDEDMFAALPQGSIAIHVGPKPSMARFRVADVASVHRILEEIIRRRG
ncbi:MAG: bifunctional alpha,alpha-trehalose-phosphate synthase (UDP-forming)/trehalose-phosphatase [Myxococcaceae bacterium]|nr:bifunctional alpha,alpha-trehalose-phosphate synthase (UDP-forming)/trehalose-phosphatase [Myxococcaceae bacterium]